MRLSTYWVAAVWLCGGWASASWAGPPDKNSPLLREQAPVYAHIAWPDPLNPDYVPLGQDQFLLFTRQGLQHWDVLTNTFSSVLSWPVHHGLQDVWAPLGALHGGRLVVGRSHDAQDQRIDVVLWWNAQQQVLSRPLAQEKNIRVQAIVPLGSHSALVCQAPPITHDGTLPTHRAARVLALENGQLHWVAQPSPALLQQLQARDVRGQIEDWPQLANGPAQPVYFDANACAWKMSQPPTAMQSLPELSIQHHRLPDGRVLVAQARWNQDKDRTRLAVGPPMLWDKAAQTWMPIELPGETLSSAMPLHAFGVDDVPVRTHKTWIEFLDPHSLRWLRSRQRFLESPWPRVAPLSDGRALVFGFDNGDTYLLERQTTLPRGQLLAPNGRFGAVLLHDGRVMLAGDGQTWSPSNRVQQLDTRQRQAHSAAPMPWTLAYQSALALKDGSVLYFGGTPPGCIPSSYGEPCSKQAAMPSFRYLPAQDRWEIVADLRLHFSHGGYWDTGNSDMVSQWPRHDVLQRRNGDVLYLDTGNPWQRLPEGQAPAAVQLMRWRLGQPAIAVAPLPEYRTQATLLELPGAGTTRRIAVVGGQADYATPLRSTLVWDERVQRWRAGPPAHYPGGTAVPLKNGRIFKLSLKTSFAESGYQAEIADRALHRWTRLPPLPLPPAGIENFRITEMVAAGNRVYLFTNAFDHRSLIWDDQHRCWRQSGPWPQGQVAPDHVLPLDAQRLLVRSEERFDVVPYPR